MSQSLSPRSAQRLVQRHLRGLHTVTRGQVAYLCEPETRAVDGPLGIVRDQHRLICAIEWGDNIYGLRHVRAQRIHSALDEEMQRRIHAPTRERQYSLDQASDEFREEYLRQFG
jgi:hypothetical protein